MKSKILMTMLIAVSFLMGATGCRAAECREMLRCCEAAAEVEGVGHTCGKMASGVRDPTTCRTILRTMRYMLEDRGEAVPAECKGNP
jgi:hypothetical protein